MIDRINRIRRNVKRNTPLIHCITNPISINQCANAVLAAGARPIMAEHPKEVAEITQTADALLLNLGNITDVRMESMLISSETAKKCRIPVVLDLVGVACSSLRREFARTIINEYSPEVIKGNYSEIYAMYSSTYKSVGVDAESSLDEESISKISPELSVKSGCSVLASGKTDIIAGDERIIRINNGTPHLGNITGTGCMLGALTACFMSEASGADAAAAACGVLGICGEAAQYAQGSGSFSVSLFDNLSNLTDADVEKILKWSEANEKI